MQTGWIKLYRAIEDSALLQDLTRRGFWISLLILATHKPRKQFFGGKIFDLQPGQFVTTERALADKFNLPKSKVRRWLHDFKTDQMLDLETDQNRTVVTIVNWALYQDCEPEVDQAMDQEVDQPWTSRGPDTRIKELKNNNILPLVDDDATESERTTLQQLKQVEGYPFDYAKDLKLIRTLAVDFPTVDLLAAIKDWDTWLMDNDINRKKWNPRSRLRRWCQNAAQFRPSQASPQQQTVSPLWSSLN